MKTQADIFSSKYSEAYTLLVALNLMQIKAEQGLDYFTTVWTFEDGSCIKICANDIELS